MPRNPKVRAVAVAVLSLAACDPAFTFDGTVIDLAGKPVPGIDVVLVCRGVDQQHRASSDGEGRFASGGIGAFGKDCAIVMRSGENVLKSFDVLGHCTKPYYRRRCTAVGLGVVRLDVP
jgi:hypothetical protein